MKCVTYFAITAGILGICHASHSTSLMSTSSSSGAARKLDPMLWVPAYIMREEPSISEIENSTLVSGSTTMPTLLLATSDNVIPTKSMETMR